MTRYFLILTLILVMAFAAAAKTGGTKAKQDDCAGKCHIIKPYVQAQSNKTLLIYKHRQAGLTCTDCHDRTAETAKQEEEMYRNKEYSDPIDRREYDAQFCLKCHESYKAVAAKTAHLKEEWGRNPHESHNGELDCSVCHRVHQPSVFLCSQCHKADWKSRLPEGWIPAE